MLSEGDRYVDPTRGLTRSDRRKQSLSRLLVLPHKFAATLVMLAALSAVALLAAPQATAQDLLAAQSTAKGKYVNPLAHAKVTPERIDNGVDYFGTGKLTSIGWARITYVGTKNTGWPGAFIEYRLLHGYYAGQYVYYAEGVRPARGIHVGRVLRPGKVVAHLIRGWSSGIEIGWGAGIGTETLAEKRHQYTFPTRCGKNFSAFIKHLGGPPGKALKQPGGPEASLESPSPGKP